MTTLPPIQRQALGKFLRAHRERLQPAMVGLPAGRRRRTPGLRREEVAQLCGFSATWYTWIEQGRDLSVSATTLGRVAEAFRLSRAERAYLFELAEKRDLAIGDHAPADLPPDSLAVIETITAPAYLLDGTWTARAWNAPASHLFAGWLDGAADRNLLRYIFISPAARTLICDWPNRARRVVAEMRADYGRELNDPEMTALVQDLILRSPTFAQWWDEHGVIDREGGERTFNHPEDGFLCYVQSTFTLAGQSDFKLVILTKRAAANQPAPTPSDNAL